MQIATIAQRSATISVDTGNEMSDYPNQKVGQNSVRNSPILIDFMLKFNKLNGGFEVTLMMFHSSCGLAPGRPKLMIKNAKSIISTAKSIIYTTKFVHLNTKHATWHLQLVGCKDDFRLQFD